MCGDSLYLADSQNLGGGRPATGNCTISGYTLGRYPGVVWPGDSVPGAMDFEITNVWTDQISAIVVIWKSLSRTTC